MPLWCFLNFKSTYSMIPQHLAIVSESLPDTAVKCINYAKAQYEIIPLLITFLSVKVGVTFSCPFRRRASVSQILLLPSFPAQIQTDTHVNCMFSLPGLTTCQEVPPQNNPKDSSTRDYEVVVAQEKKQLVESNGRSPTSNPGLP